MAISMIVESKGPSWVEQSRWSWDILPLYRYLFLQTLVANMGYVYVSAGRLLSPVWTLDNCDLETVSTRDGNLKEVSAWR